MLQVSGLTKIYGDQILFEDVTFGMQRGERLGLIGRNGCGKSTLFRLILGTETADEGAILLPRGYRVGHLAQHLRFSEPSILDEVCLGLPEDQRDQEYRAEIILQGLGFAEPDFAKSPASFSGGFQIRLNLAKLLLSEPDLLLLDEPTNYLDIVSVRWLTAFLRAWKGELIIISHDRAFMDSVTTHTMLIHRGSVRKIQGPTEKLYAQVAVDEAVYEKTRQNEAKKRKELEEFIARFRAQASKAALVQSKIKALERMGEKEELSAIANLEFEFREAPFEGKIMAEATSISFNYPGGPELISQLSLTVNRGDRIGVIGKNGKGKSTLLKLIAGEMPAVAGSVSFNQHTRLGYFGQTNIDRLAPGLTVEEEIDHANPALGRTAVRAICGTMMFSGDDALKKISVLSGGEKSRVLLGKILALKTNLLLLDEPTNHLDMQSIDSLLASLKRYQGALIIVTHSELLLRELANKLVVFDGETPRVLLHGYDYFLEQGGWGDDNSVSKSRAADSKEKGERDRRSPQEMAARRIRTLERKIVASEGKITGLELQQKKLESDLEAATQASDMDKVGDCAVQLGEISQSIDEAFAELEQLSNEKTKLERENS
ncbi:MAG: ATP-binding cassette domain-containing protein [Oligoflexia bacterium]|nr:ATP-binding cassette domain-containing protein [Oligoflexia bacterium]